MSVIATTERSFLYSVNTTTATEFSYSLLGFSPQITALTLTGFGTGFTYDENDDVIGGFLEDAEASITFSVDIPGGGTVSDTYTYHLFVDLNEDIADLLADSDIDGPLRSQLELEAEDFSDFDPLELLQVFTFDESGKILTGPNPTISYFNDTGGKFGTMIRDEILFVETGGRIDTLAGDDIVFVESTEGHVRATLRRGDDVFVGSGFGGFGPADPDAPTTWVHGGKGNDLLIGGYGADFLRGHLGTDFIYGMDGDDRLTGGNDQDHLFGGDHNDKIFAGNGHDFIDGGLGNDVAFGGFGRDVFVFDVASNAHYYAPNEIERDRVQDFNTAEDTLHFRQFGTDMSRADAFALFDANSVQDGANTVFTYLNGIITLRNTNKEDFSIDSFYSKPWQIGSEWDAFDRVDDIFG